MQNWGDEFRKWFGSARVVPIVLKSKGAEVWFCRREVLPGYWCGCPNPLWRCFCGSGGGTIALLSFDRPSELVVFTNCFDWISGDDNDGDKHLNKPRTTGEAARGQLCGGERDHAAGADPLLRNVPKVRSTTVPHQERVSDVRRRCVGFHDCCCRWWWRRRAGGKMHARQFPMDDARLTGAYSCVLA